MKDRMDEIRSTASPTLREDQIEVLMRYGETRKTEAGQVLSRAGDASYDFIVVLEGALEVVDDFAGEARIIVIQRAGGFVGELNMLTGQARYVSVMVREGGEVPRRICESQKPQPLELRFRALLTEDGTRQSRLSGG